MSQDDTATSEAVSSDAPGDFPGSVRIENERQELQDAGLRFMIGAMVIAVFTGLLTAPPKWTLVRPIMEWFHTTSYWTIWVEETKDPLAGELFYSIVFGFLILAVARNSYQFLYGLACRHYSQTVLSVPRHDVIWQDPNNEFEQQRNQLIELFVGAGITPLGGSYDASNKRFKVRGSLFYGVALAFWVFGFWMASRGA